MLESKTKFNITFSYQKHATDTIAVTKTNEPFRDENGALVFRPSGHGALIENLNEIDADIIYIKNIDNVVVNKYKSEVAKYKRPTLFLLQHNVKIPSPRKTLYLRRYMHTHTHHIGRERESEGAREKTRFRLRKRIVYVRSAFVVMSHHNCARQQK